jgi:ribosomal protein S18 acetylase RimI-like enzyme
MKTDKDIVLQEHRKETAASVKSFLADKELTYMMGKDYLSRRVTPLPDEKFLKIVSSGQDAGSLRIRWVPFRRLAWIEMIYVKPEFRGRGIGEKALSQALEYLFTAKNARKAHVLIRRDNLPLASMLKKMGAKVEGVLNSEFLDIGEPVDGLLFSFFNPKK